MNQTGFSKPRTIPSRISFTSPESERLPDEQQALQGVCDRPLRDAWTQELRGERGFLQAHVMKEAEYLHLLFMASLGSFPIASHTFQEHFHSVSSSCSQI